MLPNIRLSHSTKPSTRVKVEILAVAHKFPNGPALHYPYLFLLFYSPSHLFLSTLASLLFLEQAKHILPQSLCTCSVLPHSVHFSPPNIHVFLSQLFQVFVQISSSEWSHTWPPSLKSPNVLGTPCASFFSCSLYTYNFLIYYTIYLFCLLFISPF